MPYDPDWDLEEEANTNLNTLPAVEDKSSPSEYGSNEMVFEEGEGGEEQDDYEQGPEDVEEENRMAAELPVELPRSDQTQLSGQHRAATPRNQQPLPGAPVAGRLPKVEVVLHSSPRRAPFTAPADELGGNFSDEHNLITSDIVPNPVNNQQLAAMAQVGPPKMQPPVAPVAPGAPGPFKIPDITPQPKKRGRPVGWRRGHGSYAAMRSGLPTGSETPRPTPKKPAGEQKVRRRPGRKPAPTARQVYLKLNPHFIAFRCEWEGCPAELQNIETLRKHLLVVHGRPSTSPSPSPCPSPTAQQHTTIALPCRWASCTSAPLHSHESFASHIETAHLLPFRWHVGDGPRNTTPPAKHPQPTTTTTNTTTGNNTTTTTTTTTTDLPTYLLNAHGEQVTPSVAEQQVENEDDCKRRAARVNRVLALRDRHAPDEPEYGPRELEIIGEALAAKRARQRMLREYAERGCRGEWRP